MVPRFGPGRHLNADLRLMIKETHRLFLAIVRGGIYLDRGMDAFGHLITNEEAERIRQFLISRAHEAHKEQAEVHSR